jgi:hypothetical protein
MELESSSPYPQVAATCPYPEPTPSSLHHLLQLPEDLAICSYFFYGCVILPLETLPPPGDPNGGVVYLRIVFSSEEASLHGYFLTYVFYGKGLLAPRPTPKLEDHPTSAVRGCLFNLFTATLHIVVTLATSQKYL